MIQALKKNADSRHLLHLNVDDDSYYGLMMKQRDYYIYAYIPERTVFHALPQNVMMVIFIYMAVVTLIWLLLKNPGQTVLNRKGKRTGVSEKTSGRS